MGLPQGEDLVAYRDRAILKWYVYSGARLSTACKLNKGDVHVDGEETTVRITEKGDKHRTIGLHFAAAEAIGQYVDQAEIKRGPLFQATYRTAEQPTCQQAIDRSGHAQDCAWLPRAIARVRWCPKKTLKGMSPAVASIPHTACSATTATLLLEAGVDITKVQDLSGASTRDDYSDLRQAAACRFGFSQSRCSRLISSPSEFCTNASLYTTGVRSVMFRTCFLSLLLIGSSSGLADETNGGSLNVAKSEDTKIDSSAAPGKAGQPTQEAKIVSCENDFVNEKEEDRYRSSWKIVFSGPPSEAAVKAARQFILSLHSRARRVYKLKVDGNLTTFEVRDRYRFESKYNERINKSVSYLVPPRLPRAATIEFGEDSLVMKALKEGNFFEGDDERIEGQIKKYLDEDWRIVPERSDAKTFVFVRKVNDATQE